MAKGCGQIEALWQAGFQNVYIFAMPEYTEVLAFTDDVKLFYDGVDPMFCDACNGYLWKQEGGRYGAGASLDYEDDLEQAQLFPVCPHVVKGHGTTFVLAIQDALNAVV